MALVTLTPIIIVLLSLPLYIPLFKRSMEAYNVSWSEESIRTWWYGWRWSWIIAAGPVGRYIGGIVLGWKALDRVNGGGSMRLEVGILVAIGMMLTLITGVRLRYHPQKHKTDDRLLGLQQSESFVQGTSPWTENARGP